MDNNDLPPQPEFKVNINNIGESIESWNPRSCPGEMQPLDANTFSGYLIHSGCRGFVDIYKENSPTHNILTCRKCNLRVIIPKDVTSWKLLKEWEKFNHFD